ncbi:MAG TPA: 2-C-methyl-D-erythritol 2,4-cyclodiphosphate synthase, partial [Paludibacteraceae bacterium]|nr:2-C-methyl-D-erythritol 2,4-cyclodiphosphate synthase [Paludibacteraceae bacterium]
MKIRVGFGYDVHAFAPDRELWLGGVKIEHTV